MIVSDAAALLYLCPPKTASVSVAVTMAKEPFNSYHYDKVHAHHNTVWDDSFRRYYKFITVRHPYLRAISLWNCVLTEIQRVIKLAPAEQEKPLNRPWLWWAEQIGYEWMPLEDFLGEPALERNMRTVYSCFWHIAKMRCPVDKIVHIERMEEEIRDVPHLGQVAIPRENVGAPLEKPWHEYYNSEALWFIRNYWPMDFLPLGYNPNFAEVVQGKIFA